MINMDFSKECLLHTNDMSWTTSPIDGVRRKQLEREAAESGHITSLVRYDRQSFFPEHQHPGGEEIYIISGTFSDESGDYGPGTYMRHPPGSSHSPYSEHGCVIFVKLNQFNMQDHSEVLIDYDRTEGSAILHQFNKSCTSIIYLEPGEAINLDRPNHHRELFILSGNLAFDNKELKRYSWFRTNSDLTLNNVSRFSSEILHFEH